MALQLEDVEDKHHAFLMVDEAYIYPIIQQAFINNSHLVEEAMIEVVVEYIILNPLFVVLTDDTAAANLEVDMQGVLVHTDSRVVMGACHSFDPLGLWQIFELKQDTNAAVATVRIQMVAETWGLWQTFVLLWAATSAMDNQVVVVGPSIAHLRHTEGLTRAFKLQIHIPYWDHIVIIKFYLDLIMQPLLA